MPSPVRRRNPAKLPGANQRTPPKLGVLPFTLCLLPFPYTCRMPSLTVDRPSVVDWYQRNRARTRAIFDLIDPSAYYSRPIALRNPIVFYEGHLPAFSVIAFLRRGLG